MRFLLPLRRRHRHYLRTTTSVGQSISNEERAMLKQPMIEKLATMRLLGMAEALKAQEQDPSGRELSFLERFGLLVDQQWNWRENQALSRRLKMQSCARRTLAWRRSIIAPPAASTKV